MNEIQQMKLRKEGLCVFMFDAMQHECNVELFCQVWN
jgi:hypothetical protein